jgi:hypothetical protein
VWQRPKDPKAALFLAHGCSHGAIDFWDQSEACPKCIGLPEEKTIVKAALSRGYLPFAISSHDRDFSRCWTEDDELPVKRSLHTVLSREGLGHLPIVALGASSGGSFLPVLAQSLNITAMAVQIMATHNGLLSSHFPPTAFVHMPRDRYTASRVADNVKTLRQAGVPVKEWQHKPLTLSPTYFADRIEWVDANLSERLYETLKKADYLTLSGELAEDPRRSGWREVLHSAVPETRKMNLKPDESCISEELNVAWASHEITSNFMSQTLDFFDEMLKRSARQYK